MNQPTHRQAVSGAALDDAALDHLQTLLYGVPPPLEALDSSMLDGFLCGVLVQPVRIAESRWMPLVTDIDGGAALPSGFDAGALHALVRRRHAELDAAIGRRQWFDPWVFELDLDTEQVNEDDGAIDGAPPEVDAVYPWVAGFVTALDRFPALMNRAGPALDEALVLLYRHLDTDDLEDADDILLAIEALEPPASLEVAVEELVRATLLLADIGRPMVNRTPDRSRPSNRPSSTPRRSPPRR